jgi:serine/threonine protein kinase
MGNILSVGEFMTVDDVPYELTREPCVRPGAQPVYFGQSPEGLDVTIKPIRLVEALRGQLKHTNRAVRALEQAGDSIPPEMVSRFVTGSRTFRKRTVVAEYAEGITLAEVGVGVEDQVQAIRLKLGALWDALEPLDYLAAEGLIHRDIKPANLVLTPIGVMAIDNSGLIHESDALADRSSFNSTMAFRSPEIMQGKLATPRSDLYSFGCTVFDSFRLIEESFVCSWVFDMSKCYGAFARTIYETWEAKKWTIPEEVVGEVDRAVKTALRLVYPEPEERLPSVEAIREVWQYDTAA